ncbi:MAG: DUF2225 domain-containing protein [Planctomycetota bacterium]|nr:DUF2225 domain-containing protein [Planctomycetota bacterium]
MTRTALGMVLVVLAFPLVAGQGTPPLVSTNPNPTADESILKDLLDEFQSRKPVVSARGIGTVPEAQAKLCPICLQPLYRHADPDFPGCVPPGKRLPGIESTPVQCPVCQAQFNGAFPGNVNDRGGRDRDFCAHSIGKFSVHSNVWMCPDCGYAALTPLDKKAAGFLLGLDGKPVDEGTKEFVRQKLSAATRKRMIKEAALKEENPPPELLQFSKYVLQTQIPDWMKYDHALQIYERLKPPHTLLAKLYLEAAHACRREVCSEISAPYLDGTLLQSLSRSIERMNRFLRAECLAARRARGEPLVDPTRAETDADLIVQAAARIIQVSTEAANQRRPIATSEGLTYFTNADMFVLYLTDAGALDRLGRAEEAEKALAKALSYVPERPPLALENKTLEERVVRQLKALRGVVEERQACLKRERECLFRAAWRNMAAIRSNEIKFRDCATFKPAERSGKEWDAAPASYLVGEMLRRAGDQDSAVAWFAAAEQIIAKGIVVVDAAEKASPPAEPTPVVLPGKEPQLTPFARERNRLLDLQVYTKEQAELAKTAAPRKALDPAVPAAIAVALKAAGIAASEVPAPVAPVEPAKAAAAAQDRIPEPQAPAAKAAGSVKTREALYKMYYAAISRYRADKKENPPTLPDLVKGGYVKAEDSCLDEAGKLICPETKERLGYLCRWEPGDTTRPVLFSVKPGSKVLYADGEIREGLSSKQ